jgi:uncharacterized membrane protein YebE (DUF533 family)
MFDARKLLDALVGAATQLGQPAGQTPGQQPQAQSPGQPQPQGQGASAPIAEQVDRTLRQVTGQGTGELVQKAKDVMAQNPALAPAVMVGLAGLFSSKRRSSGGGMGGLAKLGGLALIGTLAYKAFQNRQGGKPLLDLGGLAGSLGQLGGTAGGQAPNPAPAVSGVTPGAGPSQADVAKTLESLGVPQGSGFHPVSQTEDDALLYLRAMVAAAASDGHIDEAERSRIVKGLTESGVDAEATRWLEREMASPADVEELAATVSTPQKAAQVYAAARIAIDPDTIQEREFLRRLAESLDLDQALKGQIDDTAGAVKVGG